MELFDFTLIQPVIDLLVALLLGMLIGVERTLAHKTAGIRTYGLVSLGSCLFVLIALGAASSEVFIINGGDIMRVVAGVVTGIGFLCAGVIIMRERVVVGLTTAAGLWVAAGIGVAVAFHLYALAVGAALLSLMVFRLLWPLEERVRDISQDQ